MYIYTSEKWKPLITSADIDECRERTDNCSKSGPAPADCVNTEESYKCTCEKYVGYRLSTDGTTCEGIYDTLY